MKNELDVAGAVRQVKTFAKQVVTSFDTTGVLSLYIDEIPIYCTKRAGGMRAGFHHSLGIGDVGRVVINVGVCYTDERFFATLLHELAHAICFWVHEKEADGHGPKWKEIMIRLGQEPSRCHSYRDRV